MIERGRIGSWQAVLLLVLQVSLTSLTYSPALTASVAKQDAWLSILIAIPAALFIAWLVFSLSLRFPGKTIFEYLELIIGKIPGKILAVIYVLWFIHLEILVFGEFGYFLLATILPRTPVVADYILAASLAAYISRNGLEVVGRVNQLLMVLILSSIVVVFALSAKNMELIRLLPVYDNGMVPILKGTLFPLSFLGEIFFLAVLIPYLSKPGQAPQIAVQVILFAASLIIIVTLYTITILGPNLTANFIYPTYDAVKMISIANFLERLDVVIMVVWSIGGFLKISLLRYIAALGTAQCLGLDDYRRFVTPIGSIVVAGGLFMFEGITKSYEFLYTTWPFYALTFEAGIPLLLLLIALARGFGEGKK